MTGLGDKVAQILLSRLLKTGLVKPDTPLGPVRFGLPPDALQFYIFPTCTLKQRHGRMRTRLEFRCNQEKRQSIGCFCTTRFN